jgi:hypothetical protein
MGVPPELIGRQVRCPHCKQVVVAPAPAGAAGAPSESVAPPAPAPVPATAPVPVSIPVPAEIDLPVFKVPPRKEGADSIMSEPDESDDEVFGSQPRNRQAALSSTDFSPMNSPSEPAPVFAPGPAAEKLLVSDPGHAAVASHSPPPPLSPAPQPGHGFVPTTPAPQSTTIPKRGPSADLEPVSLPDGFVQAAPPVPQPVHVPVPASEPAPLKEASAIGVNPFADFAALSTPPGEPETSAFQPETQAGLPPTRNLPVEGKAPGHDGNEPAEELPTRPARGRASGGAGGGKNNLVLIALGGYALLATAVAIYALFFQSGEKLEPSHPLSTVPDNFGEFDPATRKKVSFYKFPVDGELPMAQRAELGGKITVGNIEVWPLEVKKRPLLLFTEHVAGTPQKELPTRAALVLKLSIKNNSDVSLFPMDPAFTRKSTGDDRPITRLVLNKTTFFPGGPIPWPLGPAVKKMYEQQQANDYVPLAPGETREYVVFTPGESEIVSKVEGAREPLQWRVQVRRDPISFRGKELPVTAIIGVDFKPSDVKWD